ncbi:unnamed protein product, partial [Prunus brigantina]
VEQPERFEVKGKEDLVCRLKKSLYGLKQAPRQWYKKFDSFMIEHRYRRTTSDHCVFVKTFDNGYLITFSRGVVSWQSKIQNCVALSTIEAKFITATEACKEMLWMKQFLHELGQEQHKYILHCDSQNAIHLSKNSSFHSRSKHIDVRYHWIRDVLESKKLQLEKIHIDDNSSG